MRWATAPAPDGMVFDVQVRRPGSAEFARWKLGTADEAATFAATQAGQYAFRARLREVARPTACVVAWSPARTVQVR